MIAKASAEKVEQTMPVAILLPAHLAESLRLLRIAIAQCGHIIIVNTGVFLLQGHGQGKDFPLVKALK